jgi:DNA-binding Lrp family transcriptional regulator
MITAFILLRVDYAHLTEIAEKIAVLDNVSEIYAVAGDEDLIAIVRGDSTETVADVVTTKIAKIAGVTGCRTKIALRNYKPAKV